MSSKVYQQIIKALQREADADKAIILQRFFKTKPGEYGAGDQFWGITVPNNRKVVNAYFDQVNLDDLSEMIKSPIHEIRLCSLLIAVKLFQSKAHKNQQEAVFKWYCKHTTYINNWDLVDSSAHYIVGVWLYDKDRSLLYKWAKSKNLWEQRISVIATFYFIRQNETHDTFQLCEHFLNHQHDLMHKACGWMLRELGKRHEDAMLEFVYTHYANMPRTMLRYAIEKIKEPLRKNIILGKF